MLRISLVESPGRTITLRLEGQVTGPWVPELRRSCDRALAGGDGLTLDLAGVSFLDADGITLLRSLADRRVALTSCSPFVTQQLKG